MRDRWSDHPHLGRREEALLRRPRLNILFTTGYTGNAIIHQGRLDPGVDLLGKPYTFDDLANRIRTLLDRRGQRALHHHQRGD